MPHWKDAFPIDLAEEGRFSRREFARFLALVSAGFTAGMAYLSLRKKPLEGAPGDAGEAVPAVKICQVEGLQPGQSRLFNFRDEHDRCILLRTQGGHLRAFRQTCTHLGCAVRWDGARLECPCHLGYFEPEQGFPVQGPPTRPLSALVVEDREDGWIWVVGDLPKPGHGPKEKRS